MNWILSRIIYIIARLISSTYRYRYAGLENLEKAKTIGKSKGYLLGIWHQNLLHGILSQTGLKYVVIVSRNKDANPVAYTCETLGHVVVRGSSRKKNVDKGGKAAKTEMIEVLKTGIPGSVTVDGPKGPAREVKAGIIDMAKKSETPLVAFAPIAEKCWSFNSWDNFRLPKPFTRVVVYYGEPLNVPADTSEEEFDKLKNKYRDLINEAELKAIDKLKEWKNLSKKNFSF